MTTGPTSLNVAFDKLIEIDIRLCRTEIRVLPERKSDQEKIRQGYKQMELYKHQFERLLRLLV